MQEDADDGIRNYVRANIRTHTREAIYAALTAAGHAPERIETIWEEEWKGFAVERSVGNLRALSLSLYVLGALVGALGAVLIAGLSSGRNESLFFFLIYAVGYLGVGYGLSRLVGWGVRRFHLGGWSTFLLGAFLFPAYATLMYGGCFASWSITQVPQ